jgi:NitT/TauT family transport system ATP-binding protein
MVAGSAVSVEAVSHQYRTRQGAVVTALREVTFEVAQREFLAIVGPSGSGKSTLLHLIAGLTPVANGSIRFPALPATPRIGYLFQSDAVFPWRTVERNLVYADEIRGVPTRQRRQRAEQLCRLVGLEPATYLPRYAGELSGGELRRVGLGMALAITAGTAGLLLLDEPTSSLDWLTRRQLQAVVQAVVAGAGSAAIAVTHDVEEAVWLSDRVLVLRQGGIECSIEVNLPRPRSDQLRTTPEFGAIEALVVAALSGPGGQGAAELLSCR